MWFDAGSLKDRVGRKDGHFPNEFDLITYARQEILTQLKLSSPVLARRTCCTMLFLCNLRYLNTIYHEVIPSKMGTHSERTQPNEKCPIHR